MDAWIGGCDGLAQLERAIYTLAQTSASLAGAPTLDVLVRQVVERAGRDAGLDAQAAVDVVARDAAVAASGPLGGLVEAARRLNDGSAEAVIVVGAELDYANENARPPGQATLSFDRRAWGTPPGSGAVAIVVMRPDQVRGRRVYATIEALASGDDVAEVARAALSACGSTAAEIGYLEASASGVPREDDAEISALVEVYAAVQSTPLPEQRTCALGSIKTTVGDLGAAAGLAGLARAALSLHGRFLPGTPRWTGPREPGRWRDAIFYVAGESRPWIENSNRRRLAAVSALNGNGECAHLVLSEAAATRGPQLRYRPGDRLHLLPLVSDDAAGLLAAVLDVQGELVRGSDTARLASQLQARAQPGARFAAAILGRDRDELLRELAAVLEAIPNALATGSEWLTPRGSCFASRPLGRIGDVAFVYPGAFSSYVGLARESFYLFPWLWERLPEITGDLEVAFPPHRLYPRHIEKPGVRDLAALDAALADDAIAMMSSGVSTAVLDTQIARDGFGLAAQAAFGYSFGELSMLASLGVWPEAARATPPRVSKLFRTRLAGPKLAVREFWARVGVACAVGDEPWSSFLVLAPAAEVADVLEQVESVFLTIVNTPGEVVIAGQPGACSRILESRGWQHIRMPFAHAIHCDPMQSERDEFARIASLPTTEITGTRFYSAAAYTPVVLESATLAAAIADMSCRQFNFPRLVERVYADGVRVFVELGAAGACTRMIDACLGTRDHVAVAINRRGAAEQDTITRLLARLFSHRVPLDLAPLFGPSM